MHIFAVSSPENSNLLCLTLIFLQSNHSTMPNMFLWMSKQFSSWYMCRVSYYIFSFGNSILVLFGLLTFFSESFSFNSPKIASVVRASLGKNNLEPLLQCTQHMCPIRVHWHVKTSYKEYWRVKVTITNFNFNMNYTQWNLVAQHPNFDNLTQLFSFNYKPLNPYADISKSIAASFPFLSLLGRLRVW